MTRDLRSTDWLAAAAAVALCATACTMKKQEAPAPTGPSEFGTSITVQIVPDVITRDGSSQAVVTITARNASGTPLSNLALRIETFVNGSRLDYGTLSSRTAVTGSNGRAAVTYTAPVGSASGTDQVVVIGVTPFGGAHDNEVARTASIRLVPQGVVNPPAGLVPAFTSSPASPVENAPVLFNAGGSRANTSIVGYTWNFGNGRTGSGVTATTTYDEPGSYFVTLTIRDEYERSASTTGAVTVMAGMAPTAAFTYSPKDPAAGQQVNFNASMSTVPSGRRIASYQWDFGDGTPRATTTGPVASHSYALPRRYVVVLTVTDDTGHHASASVEVAVVASAD